MIRTKGEPGTGDIIEAVKHLRTVNRSGGSEPRPLELVVAAKGWAARARGRVAETGRLPVPNFSAGGVATPADAALMRQLGAESSSWVRASSSRKIPQKRKAIVEATRHYDDPEVLLRMSTGLGRSDAVWRRSRCPWKRMSERAPDVLSVSRALKTHRP